MNVRNQLSSMTFQAKMSQNLMSSSDLALMPEALKWMSECEAIESMATSMCDLLS